MPLFRHIGETEGLAYKKTDEFTPDEKERFIEQVNLPHGASGAFKESAFDKAVVRLVEVWDKLFADIEGKNPGGCAAYIHNCDLDTGVDVDTQVYWP
jgi:hypothetical protein